MCNKNKKKNKTQLTTIQLQTSDIQSSAIQSLLATRNNYDLIHELYLRFKALKFLSPSTGSASPTALIRATSGK